MRRWQLDWCFLAACGLLLTVLACSDDEAQGNDSEAEDDVGVEADVESDANGNNGNAEPELEMPSDPAERCEAACDRVYDDCGELFVYRDEDGGGAIPQDVCIDRCLDENKFRGGEWCVATEAECKSPPTEMIDACLPDDYHPPACSHLGAWPRHFVELEERAVELVNEHRGEGADCGGESFAPTEALVVDEILRCAARLHSMDMVDRGFFSTTNPDGDDTAQRIEEAGFDAASSSGIVTGSQLTAEQLVGDWIADSERCQTIMDPDFDHIGIGRYELEQWTLKIAEKQQ